MDGGEPHRVVMRSKIFTVGRSEENDVVIDDQDISRRHAVIENYGGAVQISDCGSQNGTYLNGELISGAVELQDGDRISFGDIYDVDVEVRQAAVRGGSVRGADVRPNRPRPPVTYRGGGQAQGYAAAGAQTSSFPAWGAPVLIAVAAIVVILLVAGLVLTLSRRTSVSSLPADANINGNILASGNNVNQIPPTTNQGVNANGNSTGGTPTPQTTDTADTRRIEGLTINVLRRLASDTPTIPESGVRDVARKVTQFRGSASVAERLRAMGRDSSAIAAQARQSGFEPALVIYSALAEMEQTRNNDPGAVTRDMLPQMDVLRATIGPSTVNSSLLLIAAYKYPFRPAAGSRQQHPLIGRALQLSRSTGRDASEVRNVWFMHEQNALNENAYDFVLTFLALGVISQRPADFGIQTSPLVF